MLWLQCHWQWALSWREIQAHPPWQPRYRLPQASAQPLQGSWAVGRTTVCCFSRTQGHDDARWPLCHHPFNSSCPPLSVLLVLVAGLVV